MRGPKIFTALLILGLLPVDPAAACIVAKSRDMQDIVHADQVVIGRIVNYRIIRNETFRRRLLGYENLSEQDRKFYTSPDTTLMSDFARFDIVPERIIKGPEKESFDVSWYNSTFGIPATLSDGRYLVALSDMKQTSSPDSESRNHVADNSDAAPASVWQAPCASAFIISDDHPDFELAQSVLRGEPLPETPPQGPAPQEAKALELFRHEGGDATGLTLALIVGLLLVSVPLLIRFSRPDG